MTSILTNNSAMAALQTLRTIGASIIDTQRQVSSGLRVQVAADNAAYWSISTTMRSDNMALSAVQDALGLGAAKVDVAYAGMEAVIDVLSEFKAKLVAAKEDGVDKAKVQAELEQLKEQVVSISKSASFSGQNWLDTDIADIKDEAQNKTSVVSSFVRGASGDVRVTTTSVDLSTISLFNSTGRGLLQADVGIGGAPGSGGQSYSIQEYYNFYGPVDLAAGESISFIVEIYDPLSSSGDTFFSATITHADVNATLGITTGRISDAHDMSLVLNNVWSGNSLGFSASAANDPNFPSVGSPWNSLVIQSNEVSAHEDTDIRLSNWVSNQMPFPNAGGLEGVPYYTFRSAFPDGTAGTTPTVRMNLLDIDVTNGVGSQLDAIEEMLKGTTAAASVLGSLKMRIELQSEFTAKMMSTMDKGIGRLVDADMNEASTRLKALQTQQQLAIQSLSIANTNAENIRQLFQ